MPATEELPQHWRGPLLPRSCPGSKVQGPFVLAGTDLELDSASVSSEWTTESEQDKNSGERRKRRVRTWRVRHRLGSDSESDSSSSSSGRSSSSSSTSTGSSSSEGEVAKFKQQRLQMLKEWEAQKAKALSPTSGKSAAALIASGAEYAKRADIAAPALPPPAASLPPPPPPAEPPSLPASPPPPPQEAGMPLEWFSSGKRYRCFALAPTFLAQQDIDALHAAAHHASVAEINDRKGYLAFKHRVWRFEAQLRLLYPSLYRRLLDLMHRADETKWKRLRRNSKKRKVYPEIEYIAYDVAEMGEPCFIEPHVDNKSAVTMVAMLSSPGSYVGGRSCFRRGHGKEGHRELVLQQGDVVLFRGEKLTHWITPVTAGRRVILQIELSRV
mmetsp:Transcript_78/g.282  ORF Transcript_78/g.282 Transcript_78/m.282 type:complete len:385 (+) Transcript_78:92-1246(+)